MQCKVCYHFNYIWVCYHLSAQLSACNRFQCYIQCKCVITSTVYGCVITYEINCLRVTAFSVTCSVKCVITSTVYGGVITYELNCLCVTTSSVTCHCIWVGYHFEINCLRVKASSIACSVSVLSRQLYIGVLSLVMNSTVGVLQLSVLHAV